MAASATPTVLIAPDSFKGSASAQHIAQAIQEGWHQVRPEDRVVLAPMADGGEGTMEAFASAVPGSQMHTIPVVGPDNRRHEASWLELPEGGALVELASSSGLDLMSELAPFDAHTYGFGQLIQAALASGATSLFLTIGGSASTDGGTGALSALGAAFLDQDGAPVPLGNRGLHQVRTVDLSSLPALDDVEVHILSDVTNPLLGESGAAAVFGRQKGAQTHELGELEDGLAQLAHAVKSAGTAVDPETPGAGAAGGTGFGLMLWGATLRAGAPAVGEALGLPALVASADVVVTGEGRYDEQSAAGKVPSYVCSLAAKNQVPTLLVAGAIQAPTSEFAAAVALSELAPGSAEAMQEPLHWARAAGATLAQQYPFG